VWSRKDKAKEGEAHAGKVEVGSGLDSDLREKNTLSAYARRKKGEEGTQSPSEAVHGPKKGGWSWAAGLGWAERGKQREGAWIG
jgi:hypothetical protein